MVIETFSPEETEELRNKPLKATIMHLQLYDIIIMRGKYGTASREQSCGAFLMPGKECLCMGYRKVSYIEQVWYIIKYKLGELFRRK